MYMRICLCLWVWGSTNENLDDDDEAMVDYVDYVYEEMFLGI